MSFGSSFEFQQINTQRFNESHLLTSLVIGGFYKVHTHTYFVVSLHNSWIKESHESIYELLKNLHEGEPGVQLGSYKWGEGELDTRKNKQDLIRESTSHWVPVWQLEATVRKEQC